MSQLIEVDSFRALAKGSVTAELLSGDMGGEPLQARDMTTVSIPTGGSTRWSWTTKSGKDFSEKAIAGLLVVVGRQESALWPHREPKQKSQPLLLSDDAKQSRMNGPVEGTAYRVGQDYGDLDRNVIEAARREDGTYDVAKIHYFQWQGRGPGSIPPRAKSSRVIGILREQDYLPIFIRVASTSLQNVDALVRGIRNEGLFCRVCVELTLEKKKGASADYAVIVGKHIGEISEEQGRIAKTMIADVMTPIMCPSASSRAIGLANVSAVVVEEAVPF